MKITQKQLRILSGFCILLGAIVVVITNYLTDKNLSEPNKIWKWAGIGIMIVGLILLMPWVEKKDKD